jgi:segregation and condensation protein B
MEMQELDAPEPTQENGPAEPVSPPVEPAMLVDDLLAGVEPPVFPTEEPALQAVLEAIVYVAEEPLTRAQIAAALQLPVERVQALMDLVIAEFEKPTHGVSIREVAGGYKMATKPEHHEAVRSFVKNMKAPLKLSLPALETLAVIAYKQPVTAPEIMEIRGVQGTGVLKTLLDRKLIAVAGRKNVIGKPILYKTTKDFLIQFGLKDMTELPTLKEFDEIRRMAMSEPEPANPAGEVPPAEQAAPPAGSPAAEALAPAESAPATEVELPPAEEAVPAPAAAGEPQEAEEVGPVPDRDVEPPPPADVEPAPAVEGEPQPPGEIEPVPDEQADASEPSPKESSS